MEYIVSAFFVVVFAVWEFKQFYKVKKLIVLYKNIFPDSIDDLEFNKQTLSIISSHNSVLFKNIEYYCNYINCA